MKNNTNKQNIIEDFGEKIGGAKKDLWKERALTTEDIKDMTDAEKFKYVVKKNVYPKPDFDALIEDGIGRGQVFFAKQLYDAISKNATVKFYKLEDENNIFSRRTTVVEERFEDYISFTGRVKSIIDKILEEDSEIFIENMKKHQYKKMFFEGIKTNNMWISMPEDHPWNYFYDGKFKKKIDWTDWNLNDALEKIDTFLTPYQRWERQIMVLSEGKHIKHRQSELDENYIRFSLVYAHSIKGYCGISYNIHKNCDELNWDIHKIKEGQAIIYTYGQDLKNVKVYNSVEEAEMALDKIKEKKKIEIESTSKNQKAGKDEKKKVFRPEAMPAYRRIGPVCTKGNDIEGDDYLKVFKFRGGEFGNWLNQDERQTNLNSCYESLLDLSNALDISTAEISLDGKLAIAFGARGSGNALAHYEPERNVINLTKMKGAGSLAHEWAHALDSYIGAKTGSKYGELATREIKIAYKPLQDFIHKMNKKETIVTKTEDEIKDGLKEMLDYFEDDIKRTSEQAYASNSKEINKEDLIDEIKKAMEYSFHHPDEEIIVITDQGVFSDADLDYSKFPKLKEIVDKTTDTDRNYLKYTLRANCKKAQEFGKKYAPKVVEVNTQYLTDSIDFDNKYSKSNFGYWQSDCEMFARAFACYVEDKLIEKGISNNYLTFHARNGSPIPKDEELKIINDEFDKLFEKLKEDGLLKRAQKNKEDRLNTYLSFAVKDCFSAVQICPVKL